ncbi:hypothetical protein V9T40_013994 [Parthenolecanium corni]|uniref:Uncharacterized protein n=1 Tax=Parthenolecanium corni TaxID=536013 RepID=A0AAN9Y1Q4_9HEMI
MISPKFSWEWWKWLKHISLEPSYFLYIIASTMLDFVNTNLYLQKACRINAISEPNLDTPCDDTEKGVTFVANVNTYILTVKMFVIVIGIIIYSSWSDQAGKKRKFFIMLPMVGLVLESAFQAVYSYFWYLDPLYAAITSAILQMIFGNFPTLQIFGSMYVADVVDMRNRTMRMGFLMTIKVIGFLLSKSISGYLLHFLGFFICYLTCFALGCITLILAYVLIKDISVPLKKKMSWCSVFNVCRLIESFKIVLGNRSTKHKVTVLLIFFMFSLLMFVHVGQESVQYLYLRFIFDWNEQMYSTFLFYGSVGTIVGTLFSSIFLSRILNIHDGIIGIVATTWDAAIAISYLFANENWQLLLISGMDIFFGVSITVCISLVTKFYDSSEMGRLRWQSSQAPKRAAMGGSRPQNLGTPPNVGYYLRARADQRAPE